MDSKEFRSGDVCIIMYFRDDKGVDFELWNKDAFVSIPQEKMLDFVNVFTSMQFELQSRIIQNMGGFGGGPF